MKNPARKPATAGWKIDVGGQLFLVTVTDQRNALDLAKRELNASPDTPCKVIAAIAPEEIAVMNLKHGEVKAYGRPSSRTP
jgi:hypothetical protein